MALKASKGKGATKAVAGKEVAESELVKLRKKRTLFPPVINVLRLKDQFMCLWGKETTGHPATKVIPAPFAKPGPDIYPFFVDYFSCGLCFHFSDFFSAIMNTYGFHLLDFTPNVVACMAYWGT